MFTFPRGKGRFLPLAVLAAGFILYGSLYPFRFEDLSGGEGVWAALLAAWARPAAGRGDVLANLLLYAPLGLLTAAALPRHPAAARLLLAMAVGMLLSLAAEVAQLYLPGRSSSAWDVLCNTAGAAGGAALVLLGGTRLLQQHQPRIIEPLPALLLLAWLGYALFPYLPALDLQVWRDNLKPLLLYPAVEPGRTLRLLVTWTAAALMAEAALGRDAARLAVPFGLAAALVAQLAMPDKRLDLAEAVALGLAPVLWGMLRHANWVAPAMAMAMLGVLLAERLEPFTFLAPPRDFGWIPLRSLINGSLEAGFQAILAKLFLQGATLWWLMRAGLRLPLAAGLLAAVVLGASLVQTYIPGRSAEITDTLLVLGLAAAFLAAPPPPARPRQDAAWRVRAMVAVAHRRPGRGSGLRRRSHSTHSGGLARNRVPS